MTISHVGTPVSRVDGRAKVTGEAKYAAEFNVPNLTYGYVVSSTVAKGKILKIDAAAALALPGVLQVFTHENAPRLAWLDSSYRDEIAPSGSPFRPLYDARIKYDSQPIALVVAETFELARYAATLVRVDYEREPHQTELDEHRKDAAEPRSRPGIKPPPKPRGHAEKALAGAAVQVRAEYRLPIEHHNPMELFATTVVRDADGKLIVYDKTQGVQNVQSYLCNVFGYAKDELRVISHYVGGAFGSGLRPQYQAYLAVLAARELKRSVRVTLTRQQMFSFGHRPAIWQRLALGAAADGTLESIEHEVISETSRFEDYTEEVVNWSGFLYHCPNVRFDHKVLQLDLFTPIDMRAPGAVWGLFALESAMDELAAQIGMDPVALRLKNYSERDANENKAYSSKELRACYEQGAERFGWSRRNMTPRATKRGSSLVGWGMATGVWEATQQPALAKAVLTADGKLTVSTATMDIGTGTYTILTQIAADVLGLPLERVTCQLGDSAMPESPVEGGSWTVSSNGSAVKAVCEQVRDKLIKLARKVPGSPLAVARVDDLILAEGQVRHRDDPARAVTFAEAMHRGKVHAIEENGVGTVSASREKFACYTHSAIFVEVEVDEDFGTVRVTRVVTAIAGGRIVNPKTARSQVLGGVVWGIGMALEEASLIDQAFGRFMNHNLADYHVAVNADIPKIDVIFVAEEDQVVNPLGAKGLGEIGIVSVAPAIANAVFHATGRRIRDLPITLDKLL